MSRYSFTGSNGYRVGPVIEATTALEARAKVTGITGIEPAHCTHLSDRTGRASDLAPVIEMPDPEWAYGHLFAQDS